jgi:hypothetical protein
LVEMTSRETTTAMTLAKTDTGAIFWITQMTAMAFSNGPSVWFEAEVSSVEVEVTDED